MQGQAIFLITTFRFALRFCEPLPRQNFKPTPSVQPLIEIDGETALTGLERGGTVLNLSPGIKFRPFNSEHWQIGAGIGFPITNRKEFDMRVVVSAFYHF